jgi:hypothetical protein
MESDRDTREYRLRGWAVLFLKLRVFSVLSSNGKEPIKTW